ncbi:hypothetical protein ABI59_04590 [Acidobacteria bacterium Mor1]|nr:hypothetical protein ABI59_04590 [Acidobacteria bacterium Mor1]
MSTWTLLLAALGLAMFLEGLPYFVSPAGVRRYLEEISGFRDAALRLMGLTLMAGGLGLAYLALH